MSQFLRNGLSAKMRQAQEVIKLDKRAIFGTASISKIYASPICQYIFTLFALLPVNFTPHRVRIQLSFLAVVIFFDALLHCGPE